MRRHVIRSLTRRVVAAAGALVAVVAAVSIATGSPAAAASTLLDHKCQVIGSDTVGNQGVQCVDLYETDTGTVFGKTEALCQNSAGTLVECAALSTGVEICGGSASNCYATTGTCGVRWGHSACGVQRIILTSPSITCSSNYWAVSLTTDIVLPVSGTEVVSGNYASKHGSTCIA